MLPNCFQSNLIDFFLQELGKLGVEVGLTTFLFFAENIYSASKIYASHPVSKFSNYLCRLKVTIHYYITTINQCGEYRNSSAF